MTSLYLIFLLHMHFAEIAAAIPDYRICGVETVEPKDAKDYKQWKEAVFAQPPVELPQPPVFEFFPHIQVTSP